MTKRLPQLADGADGLGRPTIMDRALAEDHGVRYVHLAAFAIDLDRLAEASSDADADGLPLGWEVFLVECLVLAELSEPSAAELSLLEDVCLSVLDRDAQPRLLGSPLCFAVYDAVVRGVLPESLGAAFKRWRSPPKQLLRELALLWQDPDTHAARLAQHCLAQAIEPPLSPPTLDALRELAGEPDGLDLDTPEAST